MQSSLTVRRARLPTCSSRGSTGSRGSSSSSNRVWLKPMRTLRSSCIAAAAMQQQQQQLLRSEQQQPEQPPTRPGSDSKKGSSSSSSSSGAPDEPPPPPTGPNLPPQLQQLLALLTEFGGKLGTAAVVIAWFTHIDPFGGLHWDRDQVLFGLGLFLPLMLFDAALMLPDYTISDPQEQRAVTGLFVGEPQLLSTPPPSSTSTASKPSASSSGAGDQEGSSGGEGPDSSSSSSGEGAAGVSDAEARRMADAIEAAAAAADPGAPVVIMQQQQQQDPAAAAAPGTPDGASSSGSSGSNAGLSPLLRLRVSLGLLQQVYTRANPGIGLSPAAEAVVVLVATLADEMLYRAVALTLLGLWLRDRLFEAGFDDDVTLDWLAPVTGHALQLPTSSYAQYLAVAVVAGLGVAGFAAGALREVQSLQKMQVIDKNGNASSAAAQALKSQLVSNLGAQNVTLYFVEGLREVTASVMAGLAFVSTHNLAAPLAGSVTVQTLFSLYQRISLQRVRAKRTALREKVMARQQKLEAAMQAALAAKQAQEAAVAAKEAAAAAAAAEAGASSSEQQQQQEEEEVDFLTAVLQAAEKQQQQQKQQQQAPAGSSVPIADSTPANWHADGSSSTSSNGSSSSSSSSSTPGDGDATSAAAAAAAAAASPEVAQQQLSSLLEDMLRSPEGSRVVQAWVARQDSETRESFASSSSGSSPQEAVEKLLSDPDTKAALIAELQEQLLGMSEAATKRQQQLEKSWRQKL